MIGISMNRCKLCAFVVFGLGAVGGCVVPTTPNNNGSSGGENVNDNGSSANVNDNDGGGSGDPVEVNRVSFGADMGYASLVTLTLGVGNFSGEDGFADVAIVGANTAGAQSGEVQVLGNDGSGGFPNPAPVNGSSGIDGGFEIAVADLDGDGSPELIILDTGVPPGTTGGVVILVNSDGFAASSLLPGSASNPSDVVAGDVNGDGDLDILVTTNEGTTLNIYAGNGDGSVGTPTTVPLPASVGDIKLADMDEDGSLDLLMSLVSDDEGTAQNQAAIMFGDGAGQFSALLRLDVGLSPDQVAAVDINNDGHLDVIVGHLLDAFRVFLGAGDGTFGDSLRPTGIGSAAFDVADMDGDGNLDLVGKGLGSSNPQILYGDGEGGFPEFQNFDFGPTTAILSLQTADLNNDNVVDLVAVGSLQIVEGLDLTNFTVIVKLQTP